MNSSLGINLILRNVTDNGFGSALGVLGNILHGSFVLRHEIGSYQKLAGYHGLDIGFIGVTVIVAGNNIGIINSDTGSNGGNLILVVILSQGGCSLTADGHVCQSGERGYHIYLRSIRVSGISGIGQEYIAGKHHILLKLGFRAEYMVF